VSFENLQKRKNWGELTGARQTVGFLGPKPPRATCSQQEPIRTHTTTTTESGNPVPRNQDAAKKIREFAVFMLSHYRAIM